MKSLMKIGYGLLAMICLGTLDTQAQSRIVPADPEVPHFIQLMSVGTGSFLGEVAESQLSLQEQVNYDLPHGEQIHLTATADQGSTLTRITEIGPDGREMDLELAGLPTSSFSFDYYLNYSVVLKAYFTKRTYAVNWQLTHLHADNQPTTAEHGTTFAFTLIPDSGYVLPDAIEIGHWENGREFTYDAQTGRVVLLAGLEYAITITAEAEKMVVAPEFSMKWNSFAGRYFETKVTAEAQYGIQVRNSADEFLFRYVVRDYAAWKDVLNMEYADNPDMEGAVPFDFSTDGSVDILSSATDLLPDAYNTYFRFVSEKAGMLQFDIEVYDVSGTELYATLEDVRVYFADPIQLSVVPEIKGYAGEDITFDLLVHGLDEELSAGQNGTLLIEMDAMTNNTVLQTTDIVLSYAGQQVAWEEKDGVFYASVALGPLSNNEPYSFLFRSLVPLTATNALRLRLSDDRYVLPVQSGAEILPDITEKEVYFTVHLPDLTGAQTDPESGDYSVIAGETFSFRILLDEAYDQSLPEVKVRDQLLTPDAEGNYTVRVDRDLVIEITGIQPNSTTAIQDTKEQDTYVCIYSGRVKIGVAEPSEVRVTDLSGRCCGTWQVGSGETYLNLTSGIYLIRVAGKVFKVGF